MVRITIEHDGNTHTLEVADPNLVSMGEVERAMVALVFPDLEDVRLKIAFAAIKALGEWGCGCGIGEQ